jgi:uncharacterized membrane protein YcaP (DUF421 family)
MNEFNGNDIIIRGKFIKEHLASNGLSINGILEQLKDQNIDSLESVQYAEIQIDGNLYVETN